MVNQTPMPPYYAPRITALTLYNSRPNRPRTTVARRQKRRICFSAGAKVGLAAFAHAPSRDLASPGWGRPQVTSQLAKRPETG
ncbi:hypothetical protein AFLA_004247 [Aspergillus flavus NRRL3357]|nr:hypothetical protein AFLA_004247 [Aspergillus flavus NRRL3357]